MTEPSEAPGAASAYEALGAGAYRSTRLTSGPWNPEHQHAGPPIALVGGAIARAAAELGLTHMARITANLLRPIPVAELSLSVETDYAGRNAAHFSARLEAQGKEVARFNALAMREAPVPVPRTLPGHPLAAAPRALDDSPPTEFPPNIKATGYNDLVETRVAAGTPFRSPSAVWFRLRYPLIEGETPLPIERVAVAADSGNGISAILDFRRYVFVNSDLSIHLLRAPRGEWICLEAQSLFGGEGSGMAEARLYDTEGLVGRSVQSLTVRMRE